MFKAIKEKKKDKGSCDYFFLILVKEYVLSVQKNRLNETVLLCTHNIC